MTGIAAMWNDLKNSNTQAYMLLCIRNIVTFIGK